MKFTAGVLTFDTRMDVAIRAIICSMDTSKDSSAAFNLMGIDHIVLRVTDLDRSIQFYCDVLGCHLERTVAGLGLVQLRAGRSLVDLVSVDSVLGQQGGPAPRSEGHNMDHVCLRIEPFDPDVLTEHLRIHGAPPGAVGRRYGADGYGPSIYINDPDGNTVELKGPPDDSI